MGQICNLLKPAIPLVSNYTECKQSYLLRQNSSRVYIAHLQEVVSLPSLLLAILLFGKLGFESLSLS